MKRVTICAAFGLLLLAGIADARTGKGLESGATTPRWIPGIGPPATRPGLAPPDIEVAVPVGRTGPDSVRIRVRGDEWGRRPGVAPLPPRGDRLYPNDLMNPGAALLRPRREAYPLETNILNRGAWPKGRMNALSFYFAVSEGGAYGFRVLYDRRIRPSLGLNVSGEFTTFGLASPSVRTTSLPDYTTGVSVIGLYTGLQQRFADRGRVVLRIGAAAGPVLRVDHRDPGFYYSTGYAGPFTGQPALLDAGVPFGNYDFPRLSITAGGYAGAGVDVVLDRERLYAISLDGRYNLIRFYDALGNPGNFSGFALYAGIGRRF